MKQIFLYIVLIIGGLSFACGSNTKKEVDVPISSQMTIKEVPSKYVDGNEHGLYFKQDTLYHQQAIYSGYVYKLYPSKDTAFIGAYLNGLQEGAQKKWYPNHQLAESRFYHDGKKVDKHIGFWEEGHPKFEYHFLNGEQHGMVREWYKNGQPYKVFHYENGYESGSQKMWWENGVIRANYVVKNGRRYGLVGLKLCMNQTDSIKTNIQ
jgi:antitoxin component YwqK of YwqJK toxin-antitoxin module